MKKLLLSGVLAGTISLGGCSTLGGFGPTDIISFRDQVIATTEALCSFEPTLATIANLIIAITDPQLATVTGMADAICKAVKPIPAPAQLARRSAAPSAPTVAGVVIHGRFLK
jgi:predicted small secreted protein